MKNPGNVGQIVQVNDCYARKVGDQLYVAFKPRGKAWACVYLNFKTGKRLWGKVKARENVAISWVNKEVQKNHPRERGDIEELV
jgi:hypothetical protein